MEATTCPHPPEHHYRWRGSEHGIHDSGEACAECDSGPSSLRPPGRHG